MVEITDMRRIVLEMALCCLTVLILPYSGSQFRELHLLNFEYCGPLLGKMAIRRRLSNLVFRVVDMLKKGRTYVASNLDQASRRFR